MRLLVAGSRDWVSIRPLRELLLEVNDAQGPFGDVTLVHGGATGAEALVRDLGEELGLREERHEPEWDVHDELCALRGCSPGRGSCKRAPLRRSRRMVELGADLCLGFLRGDAAEARTTLRLAADAGIPIIGLVEGVRQDAFAAELGGRVDAADRIVVGAVPRLP